ncbi:MAG: septum formation initiator family protein [Bacteroidales bacterium]|jgi:cell division protein FtsB|nr:septum formation initiator family protein [Bacteroidales bacterium]MDD2425071.1 septum formation initiator family protein [Bacteroidales bacterium]MDD3988620.1 septum formation initiator family protein [Bacteroidales bacterium]
MWNSLKESRFVKIISNKYIVALLIFVVWVTFFDRNNLIRWAKVNLNISSQRREILHYQREIKATEEKLNELSSNLDSLEKFAREQYYFHQDDEMIFIVGESPETTNP